MYLIYVERMGNMLKRMMSFVLTLVLVSTVITALSFSADALTVGVPTQLYMGYNGEAGNIYQNRNIANLLTGSTKQVGYIYESSNYRFKYYVDDNKDYVLYLDGYDVTEPYVRGEYSYGIYCVGDLILDFNNANAFKVLDSALSYGIYVDGILTIRCDEGLLTDLAFEGGLKGIYAGNIVIENGSITSTGRTQYGIETGSLLIKDGDLTVSGKSYGIKTDNIGMCGGSLSGTADDIVHCSGMFVNNSGTLEGDAYLHAVGDNYYEVKLIQEKSMFFKLNSSILDGGSFKASAPFSFVSANSGVVKANNEQDGSVTASGRGTADVNLVMMIGTKLYVMDSCTVTSDYLTFQWIIIIVFFGWIWYK